MNFRLRPLAAVLRSLPAALPLGAAAFAMSAAAQSAPAGEAPAPVSEAAADLPVPLSPMEVEGTPIDDDYLTGRTRVGRQEQSPQDIPQSVTVIGEGLIQDRAASTLREALRNVAGLTFNAGEGGRIGDNITIRGYSVVGDLYLDGMRDAAQYNREVFDLEQIDVLRGSASMLFGRGSTGGIVNQASKQPKLERAADAAITGGFEDYKRLTADYNQPLSASSAMRVNGMFTDTRSFREGVEQNRWGLAPAYRWGIDGDDEVAVAYYHLEDDNVPDYGVPYFQGRPIAVPAERFYGLAETDRERNVTGIATAGYTHRFGAETALRTTLRNADYARELWATAPRLADPNAATLTDDAVVNRQRQWRGSDEHAISLQSDLTTQFATFGLVHDLLTGIDAVSEEADRWSFGPETFSNPTTTVANTDPAPALPAEYRDQQQIRRLPAGYEGVSYALYAQDTLRLAPAWKLLVGGRWDHAAADYTRTIANGDVESFSRNDAVWSWRSGTLFQPDEAQTYYVSYGTSFNPSAELYQLDAATSKVAPERSRNVELGAKWLLLGDALALRTAVARTQKTDERNTDLSTNESVLYGRRHTDSIEIEAIGRLTPTWEIAAAGALLDAAVDRAMAASNPANSAEGKVPINTPDYTSSLWSTWSFVPKWKVGAGAEAVGERFGNAGNGNSVPAYVRWDAMLAYDDPRYEVQLNVLNLADAEYFEGVYAGHAVPGTARMAYVRLELKL